MGTAPRADGAPSALSSVPSAAGNPAEVLEQEQRRLARDIHDGPAQALTNLALHGEVIERLIGVDDVRAVAEVRALRQTAMAAADELRQMIYQLVPPGLVQRDLVTALAEYVDNLRERHALTVRVEAPGGLALAKATEVTVFRVIQAALQNVLRHSGVQEAWVAIRLEGDDLLAEIRDLGRGLDPGDSALLDGRRLGLIGMRERADLAGGSLTIDSRPGAGTRVLLRVPR